MATTYGYGGEFSSDEDIERIEASQQQQAKFQNSTKPDKRQLETIIEAIRSMEPSSDVNLTDEHLAGLLEYYKTQRGPIVDSTRGLYKKIVLRLIRGEQPNPQQTNGDHHPKETTNDSSHNNNVVEKPAEAAKLAASVEVASSDDDEPMPPATAVGGDSLGLLNKKKLDPRVLYPSSGNTVEPMEVDTDAASRDVMMMRLSKQIDLSTSDDDDEGSETEESSADDDSQDSELLDVTPIKPVATGKVVTQASSQKIPASSKSSTESVVKKRITTSTPNKVNSSEVKKPYTRSQRVTTRASSMVASDKSTSASKQAKENSSATTTVGSSAAVKTGSASRVRFVLSAAIVVILALVLYYFRSDLKKSTDNIVKGIKF